MASLIYGALNPNVETVEYKVNADEVWHHAGATFCILGADGYVTQALSGTATIFGYAIIPKGVGAGTASASWKASATDGKDTVAVVLASAGETFIVPADDTATLGQSGNACDLLNASATDSTVSLVDIGASSTDVFIIQGLATDRVAAAAGTDILVKVNPAKLQADT